jgi:hypothetical protein
MSDVDNNIRSKRAVVTCLRDLGNGFSKLIFDDVVSESASNRVNWSFESFYTWRDYPNENLDETKLTPQQYQEIGENLVARLLALNGRVQ